jgi:hypothetical protein
MPRGDRTGPMGQGMMTGRGMGFCNGYDIPGYVNCGFGFGLGRGFRGGFGRGTGRGRMVFNTPQQQSQNLSPDVEKEMLKAETDALKKQLDYLTKRMEELEEKK